MHHVTLKITSALCGTRNTNLTSAMLQKTVREINEGGHFVSAQREEVSQGRLRVLVHAVCIGAVWLRHILQ